ncbi:AraC family transcriptional regulator [Hoeflea poritis]|uniref:AraC family transcriptional regulator ligand-binding domain-containing protein n=1 Tax=Hoeflea poritis TaxID=2993659 RepID=A0ABT4VKF0_9HYPH|nr:AraC family transcriptional regulator [Hoeflea poritis]MDA4845156.1 AraC family transcriptional regulator ligand-binding domain-containing protein [Hoeflea poritis]
MKNASQKRSPGSVRILCEAAPSYNVEAEQCLEGTGLVTFDLYSSDMKVTLAQEVTAIGNFLKYAPNRPGLGVEIGRRYRPEVFGIWGYAILSSPTFRASLKTAIDYANLSFIIATVGLDELHDPPLLTFDTSGLSPRVKSFVLERHLTVLANFSAQLLPKFSLSDFTFLTTLDDPDVAAAIESMLGISVMPGRPRDAIALPKDLLDRPLPQHDPAVMEYCLGQCRNLLNLEDRPYPKWTAQVREATLLEMGNDPTIGTVAAKLGVTERTLRRRLSEESTSFRQILVDARLAIGHELLKTAGLDVTTVAWRTGYSEPSSFVRAFTKKYNYSPGSLKKDAAHNRVSA